MSRELRSSLILGLPAALASASAQDVVPARLAALGPRGLLICSGAERAAVPGSAGLETFAWDRGGAAILGTQGGELLRIDLTSGHRRVLVREKELRFPDAAPRSGRIAFAFLAAPASSAARWHVAYVHADGSGFADLGSGYDPCWSHDEEELWFEDFDAQGPALFALALATGERRRLADDAIPRHSVDRGQEPGEMIWSSQRHLYAGAPLAPRACTSRGRDYDRFGSYSPERRHLLFFREDEEGRSGIVLRELSSGAERWLSIPGRIDLAAFAPAAPPSRTLADFRALSRAAVAASELATVARLDEGRYAARLRVLREDLARSEAPALLLPGVLTLDPREAEQLLASNASQLVLPDLSSLEIPAARVLASWATNAEQAFLALDGLREAEPELLGELAKLRGWGLSLGGLARLHLAQAAALSSSRVAWLDLRGVREMEVPVARALLSGSLKFVDLRGLEPLHEDLRALLRAEGPRVLWPRS